MKEIKKDFIPIEDYLVMRRFLGIAIILNLIAGAVNVVLLFKFLAWVGSV